MDEGLKTALDRPGAASRYGALAGLRILVVDDDHRAREVVRDVLVLTGACVQSATSAADAMAAVDAFEPQVIVCDVAMPEEDGYTFIRKLRARGSKARLIPALALSALAATDDRCRALAAGFQLHLAKPIDIARLRDAVLELSKTETGDGA